MGGRCRTAEEIVEELLANAIPNGECLECHLRPSVDRAGRERQYVAVGGRNGKKWGVPRLVLHVKKGPLPDDIWTLHTCDNSKCINEDHLFKGTAQDNTDDMIAKGRKVDDQEVGLRRRIATWNLIRPLHEQGLDRHEIAARLRISANTVWNYISERGSSYQGGSIPLPSGDESAVCVGLSELGSSEDLREEI